MLTATCTGPLELQHAQQSDTVFLHKSVHLPGQFPFQHTHVLYTLTNTDVGGVCGDLTYCGDRNSFIMAWGKLGETMPAMPVLLVGVNSSIQSNTP